MGVRLPRPEPQSPLSVGMAWAARVSSLGLEFALPALLGDFLDRKWGTRPAGLLVGMVVGFAVGMLHIFRIARGDPRSG